MSLLLTSVRKRLGGSPWLKPACRVALGLLGALVLAWVGRSVVAGGAVLPAAAATRPETSVADAVASAPSPVEPAPNAPPDAGLPAPLPEQPHAARASADDPVFLNQATSEDLRRLPGIGEKRALAILQTRSKLGRFKQIEDLLRVKGIGRATLKRLRPIVRLERGDGGARSGLRSD